MCRHAFMWQTDDPFGVVAGYAEVWGACRRSCCSKISVVTMCGVYLARLEKKNLLSQQTRSLMPQAKDSSAWPGRAVHV